MNSLSLLEQLHDIEGLDAISAWPLAIGWWVLIALGTTLLCTVAVVVIFRMAFLRSWKNDTFQKLSTLEANLSDATARETAIALSEYLRRIALRRYPRKECAGLTGAAWLSWLTMHDPHHFDWQNKGKLLVEAPYAPMNNSISPQLVKDLIQATRGWVR